MAVNKIGEDTINATNSADIYDAYFNGKEYNGQKVTQAQATYAKKFLSDEQIEDIEYGIEGSYTTGKNAINTEGTDSSEAGTAVTAGAATAGSAVACGATIAAVCTSTTTNTATGQSTNGFGSMLCGAMVLIGAAVALALSFKGTFDPNSSDREARNGEAESTNELIDANSQAMVDTMDMMNEDAELYQEQNDILTVGMNEKAAEGADLKQQLADAEAAGDVNGAKRIKEDMKNLDKEDFEEDLEGIDETRGRLEEYSAANSEALGVSESGRAVSDFLKVGKVLSPIAMINGALLTVATTLIGIATALGAIPKIAPFFPDAPAAISSAVVWAAAGLMMGYAATNMFSNASFEKECGQNGDIMGDKTSELENVVEQQNEYIEVTTEGYDESDEKADEDRAKGQKKADDRAPGGAKNLDKKGRAVKDDEEEETPQPTGSTA